MSDFDKDAEREKLREKYEQEQEEREATEKMSELLLQGATMTNAHCSECGDPIFRYDGQEFCATCEKAVDRDTGEGADQAAEDGDSGADADEAPDDGDHIEVATPDDARVKFGGDDPADDGSGAAGPAASEEAVGSPDPESQRHADGQPQRRQGQQGQPERERARAERRRPSQDPAREVPGVDPSGTGDVTAARESLVRTLTRFSRQAEAAEDPQRAREYLAAAREAAEALSALRN